MWATTPQPLVALVFSHLGLDCRGAFARTSRRTNDAARLRAASPTALALAPTDDLEFRHVPRDWFAEVARYRGKATSLPAGALRLWPTTAAVSIAHVSQVEQLAASPSWCAALRHLTLALGQSFDFDLNSLAALAQLETLILSPDVAGTGLEFRHLPHLPSVTRFECGRGDITHPEDVALIAAAFPNLVELVRVDLRRNPPVWLGVRPRPTAALDLARMPRLACLSARVDADDAAPFAVDGTRSSPCGAWHSVAAALETLDLELSRSGGDDIGLVVHMLADPGSAVHKMSAQHRARIERRVAQEFVPLPMFATLAVCARLTHLTIRATNVAMEPTTLLCDLPALQTLCLTINCLAPGGLMSPLTPPPPPPPPPPLTPPSLVSPLSSNVPEKFVTTLDADASSAKGPTLLMPTPRISTLVSVTLHGEGRWSSFRFPPIVFTRLESLVVRAHECDLVPLELPASAAVDLVLADTGYY